MPECRGQGDTTGRKADVVRVLKRWAKKGWRRVKKQKRNLGGNIKREGVCRDQGKKRHAGRLSMHKYDPFKTKRKKTMASAATPQRDGKLEGERARGGRRGGPVKKKNRQ